MKKITRAVSIFLDIIKNRKLLVEGLYENQCQTLVHPFIQIGRTFYSIPQKSRHIVSTKIMEKIENNEKETKLYL